MAERDRLAERGNALPADLLADVAGEQPRGEPRVLLFLADHLRRGLDRQPVQFRGGRAVVQATDRLGRHPQRIYVHQIAGAPVHGPHDLVHVHGLGIVVALADLHAYLVQWLPVVSRAGYGGPGISDRHALSSRARARMAWAGGGHDEASERGRYRRPASHVAGRPARPQTTAHGRARCAGRSSDSRVGLWPPTGHRFPGRSGPVLDDGVRSRSPLRGSPELPPGSLLPPRPGDGSRNQLPRPSQQDLGVSFCRRGSRRASR